MNKERFEREHNWIIDNNKRNTEESLIVYDEECNTLDDLCELLNQQDQTISDLESKLAEKDLRIEELESQFGYECECNKQFVDCQNENEQLKQQLAEKGKRSRNAIDDLKNKLNKTRKELEIANNQILFDNTEFEKLNKQLTEKESWYYAQLCENEDLERQLAEKEKEYKESVEKILSSRDKFILEYNQDKISFAIARIKEIGEGIIDAFNKSFGKLCLTDVKEIIDNQIASLKKEMK